MVHQRHFDKIRREDDRRCSCPSTWGHSSKLHGHAIPSHFFQVLDQAGSNFPCYQPGTRWCNKCQSEAPKRIQKWPKKDENSENIATKRTKQDPVESMEASFLMSIFSYDAVLKETWRKTLILLYVIVLGISVKHLFTFPKYLFLS